MWIRALQLEAFRNYSQCQIEFMAGVNLITGENGSGKTNLVEACVFLSDFESHRTASYSPLINAEKQSSQISAKAVFDTREISVAAELNRSTPNRFFLNGNQRKRQSEVIGAIQVVAFAPEDLDLVRRDPQDRRKFLDLSLSQIRPRFAGVRADYDRVLKQKTALLKSAKLVSKPDLTTLDIWDDQLVALGTELTLGRLELISKLEPKLQEFYGNLSSQDDQLSLKLASSFLNSEEDGVNVLEVEGAAEISELFLGKLQDLRPKELERGQCLVGPHRDELLILKNGLNSRNYSSQGEAWSLALGLKLALAELIRSDSQSGDPILILDDVFAVLDSGRRRRLMEHVSSNEQVLITSADPEAIAGLEVARSYKVERGEIIA